MLPPKEQAHFSRRDFLKVSLAIGGLTGADWLRHWGISIPAAVDEEQRPFATPGWLETRNPDRPAFISADSGGHRNYVYYMTTHDSLLSGVCSRAFYDLEYRTNGRPTVEESFAQHIVYATDEMQDKDPSINDIVHVAFFSFAAVYSNFYTYGDVRHIFNVHDVHPEYDDGRDFSVYDYEQHVPLVFKDSPPRDIDKVMHVANFGFLAHQFEYARLYGLQEAERIPRLAHAIASVGYSPEKEAEIIVFLGGIAWELYEMSVWINHMVKYQKFTVAGGGYFDPGVGTDLQANIIGLNLAKELTGERLTPESVRQALAHLGQQ
jgi:hypothetical protein